MMSKGTTAGPADVVAVFLKYPEPGRVKSRLAAAIGAEQAATVYRAMAEEVLGRIAGGGSYETWVFYHPPERADSVARWLAPHPLDCIMPQRGSDLGERMYNAFGETEGRGAVRTVLIGTDCPSITVRHVELAFEALEGVDVVLGPALDGGYYLVATARAERGLFDGIHWGGETVLRETLLRIEALDLTHRLLEPLRDIDCLEDYIHYVRSRRGGGGLR